MHPNEHHNSMSRVFDFVERWVAETEQKRAARGGDVERKSQKAEKGSAVERHFETGLWPTKRGSALWQTRAH